MVEEIRRRVYQCLSPPFEELFDGVEEHILSLLLEPWTLLLSRDTHSYQRVGSLHIEEGLYIFPQGKAKTTCVCV